MAHPETFKRLVKELPCFFVSLKDNLAVYCTEHKHCADLDPGI